MVLGDLNESVIQSPKGLRISGLKVCGSQLIAE